MRLAQIQPVRLAPDAVMRKAARDRPQRLGRRLLAASAPTLADLAGLEPAELVVVHAAHGVAAPRAVRGPVGDHVQVLRQAPRGGRREHVVLEREVVRPAPVVGDLARVVIAHDVGRRRRLADRCGQAAGAAAGALRRTDEAVHAAAVHVRLRGVGVVLRSAVHLAGVVVRVLAVAAARIAQAHAELPTPGGDPVGAREGAEVRVERAVLLHDHHHVPDPVDPVVQTDLERRRAHDARVRREAGPAAAGEYQQRNHHGDEAWSHGVMVGVLAEAQMSVRRSPERGCGGAAGGARDDSVGSGADRPARSHLRRAPTPRASTC